MKKTLQRLVMLIGSILLIEIVLNIIYTKKYSEIPFQIKNPYELDSNLIYRLRKDYKSQIETDEYIQEVYINKQGFRNSYQIRLSKPKDIYRIVVYGDSFTFGHGLKNNETFTFQLEKRLNGLKNIQKKIEVLNAGVVGYSPDQSYKKIISQIDSVEEDMIILALINQDIEDIMVFHENYPSLYDVKNNSLIENNAIFTSLYIKNFALLHTPKFIRHSSLFDLVLSELVSTNFLLHKNYKTTEEGIDWAMTKIILELKDIKTQTDKQDIRFLIVRLPSLFQHNKIFDPIFTELKQDFKKNDIEFYDLVDLINKDLESEKEIKISDSIYLGRLKIEDLFYKKDGHPNPIGAQIIAYEISKYLLPIFKEK